MRQRRTSAFAVGALLALFLSSVAVSPSSARGNAIPALGDPGDTSQISMVSSTVSGGYRFDHYRNRAYPCSLRGYQTFTIATAVGSSPTDTRPLWTYMHGGGVGYFLPGGRPAGGPDNMTEESASTQRDSLERGALNRLVARAPAGFRALAVSMCNRDLYGGPDVVEPNNPRTTPDGAPRTVNGLFATKAAIQFTMAAFPTDDHFLYGTSAGAAGTFHVAWSLQQQGIPPTGIVADSGVINEAHEQAQFEQGICGRPPAEVEAIRARLHPDMAAPGNGPDELVSSGRLTAPIMQVWVTNDGGCGDTPMACPLPDGTSSILGSTDCLQEPLRLAIADQGPTSRSASMRLCVDNPRLDGACDQHVPTVILGARNTLAPFPAQFDPVIVDWVEQRLADD